MTDTLALEQPALPPACARELQIAVLGAMKFLADDVMHIDEDGAPDVARLARISPSLVIVERPGDRARPKPHRFTCYRTDGRVEAGVPFRLDPDRALFVLHVVGFYRPADWTLSVLKDPRIWYNVTLLALYAALRPVLPAA